MRAAELPSGVKQLLEREGLNGVPVVLSAQTDLGLRGEPGSEWLVMTERNVSVVAEQPEPYLVKNVPVAEVGKFRSVATIGSGFVQAHVDGAWVDLLRHSNGLAPRFHRVAGQLEHFRAEGDLGPEEVESPDLLHCPQCQQRLPAKGEPCPRCLPRRAIIGRLWRILQPHWRTAAAMSALMLAGVAMELVPPKLQQYLVDQILERGEGAPDAGGLMLALLLVVLALAATRVLLGVINWGKGVLSTRVGAGLTFDLRSQLMAKLHTLGVGYYDKHQVSSLVSRVAYDSEVLHTLLQQVTGGFLLQIVQVVAVGLMLFTLNAKLALFTLIPAPLVVAGSLYFWRRVYPVYYRYWDSSSRQAGTISGMLSGIRVVKAFAQEPRESERFQRASETLRDSRVRVDNANASFSAIMALVFSLGGLIVWYVGGRDVLAGQMTLGSLMAFLAYLAMFYAPLSTLSQLTTWLTSFLTGCHRVFELLDAPVETREPERESRPDTVRGEIAFDNVTFGYERHRPVLKQVSFQIEPGQRIGIVGRSGSGKTTLVNLISRFYDVDEGTIRLDGVDLRQLSTAELRRHVGVVLQEPFLFRGTLFDNLVYGRPGSNREEALTSARAAQAHEFILKKPLGYDTWVGERGAGLSGGERQRLSIARALLYDPRVLILDEATSSVDTESEQAIQDALRVLARGRTTIAIAHRLSTLKDSDRIFVFEEGRLAEQGSHAELMDLDGTYARLVKIQTQFAHENRVEALLEAQASPAPRATALSVGATAPAASATTSLATGDSPDQSTATGEPAELIDLAPHWLEAGVVRFSCGRLQTLDVELADGTRHRGLGAVRCFPATEPERYISLSVCDEGGKEREIGIVRDLGEWPEETRTLILAALDRRYLLRRIDSIERIDLKHGCLEFTVGTPSGRLQFTMRWSQSQVQDFGEHGKILLDLEDNRFLIPHLGQLPSQQRELLQRYIYW
ncbi:MAG: DUF1854 domain-containing protein [Planctomycetaceae bacterium]